MRDEFLTRRPFGNWESIAGDSEQKTQARFPISGAPPGSFRSYGGIRRDPLRRMFLPLIRRPAWFRRSKRDPSTGNIF